MASVQQGRGKATFRSFSKTVGDAYRNLVKSIKSGEEYLSSDIIGQFDQIFLAFIKDLTDNEVPNIDLWRERAEQLITRKVTEIFDKFGENEDDTEEDDDERGGIIDDEENGDDDTDSINEEEGVITIGGIDFPIITRQEAPTLRRSGRLPRNRIFATLGDIESYLFDKDWPYEYIQLYGGIEIIRRGTAIVGYRIWIG